MQLSDDVKEAVRKQVEFYFSDSNYPKDAFLKEQAEKHPEGYIDLSLLVSFPRMIEHLKLTKGMKPEEVADDVVLAVADCLRHSEVVEVGEDGFQIKRKPPLPADLKEVARTIDARSLYVRPFPFTSTMDDLTKFFNQHAPVNCVRLRRHLKSKQFKGSVFVEFRDPEAAEKVLECELEYEGAPLYKEKKIDYMRRKIEERKRGQKLKPDKMTLAALEEADSDFEILAFKDVNEKGGANKRGTEGEGDDEGGHEAEEEGATKSADVWVPGCILHFTLEGDRPERLTGFTLRGLFPAGHVRFVEQDHLNVRTHQPEQAQQFAEEFGKRPEEERKIEGVVATVEVLQGEAEEQYYSRASQSWKNRPQGQKRSANWQRDKGRGRGRGRGPFKRSRQQG